MDLDTPLLRPLTLGELLDRSYRVYRDGFGVFARVGMLASIPVALLSGLYQLWIGDFVAAAQSDPFDALVRVYGGLVPVLLISMVFWSLGAVATTAAADAVLNGRRPTAGAVLAASVPRWPSAFVTAVLATLCTVLACCLCCLPAVPALILLALAVPLVWLERRGPLSAIERSIRLVWGGSGASPAELPWVRVLVVGIVSTVVVYVLSAITGLPTWIVIFVLGQRGEPFLLHELPPGLLLSLQLVAGILQGLFVALGVIPWTLVYHDLRARREGADLELRARRLAEDEAPT
jgi:hypothetical protein